MKLIIVRHGDPDYKNDSLTEKGFKEAELLKNKLSKLNVDKFYCSPLGRAMRTSEPTLKLFGKKAEILPWLREFDGYVVRPEDGKQLIPWDLLPEYWNSYEEFYDCDEWLNQPLMQTGTLNEKYKYVIGEFDKFLENHGYKRNGRGYKAVRPNKDTVVLFCHWGIEAVLLSRLLNISPVVLWHNFVALPTSITTIVTEERREGIASFRVRHFGELPHLYEAGENPSEAAAFCEVFTDKDARH